MKIYNRYVITTAILLLLTTVILVAAGQSALDVYFTVYCIEALIVTELFIHLNSKARRGLSLVSLILFGGFLVTVTMRVIQILM